MIGLYVASEHHLCQSGGTDYPTLGRGTPFWCPWCTSPKTRQLLPQIVKFGVWILEFEMVIWTCILSALYLTSRWTFWQLDLYFGWTPFHSGSYFGNGRGSDLEASLYWLICRIGARIWALYLAANSTASCAVRSCSRHEEKLACKSDIEKIYQESDDKVSREKRWSSPVALLQTFGLPLQCLDPVWFYGLFGNWTLLLLEEAVDLKSSVSLIITVVLDNSRWRKDCGCRVRSMFVEECGKGDSEMRCKFDEPESITWKLRIWNIVA